MIVELLVGVLALLVIEKIKADNPGLLEDDE